MFKKVFLVFIKGFLTAILVIVCMVGCAVGGFFGTRYYYLDKADRETKKEVNALIGEAQMDDVSRNLIFEWNQEQNKITGCVLEVFDTANHKVHYITIPTSGEITISRNLYKKIVQVNKEIPQAFRISKLCSFFPEGDDTAYGYGVILLEDYFGIDISYYTIVDAETLQTVFEKRKVQVNSDGTIQGDSYAKSSESSVDVDTDTEDSSVPDGSNPYEHDDRFATEDSAETMTTQDANATTAVTSEGTTTVTSTVTDAYGNPIEVTTEAPIEDRTKVNVRYLADSFKEEMSQYEDKGDLKDYIKSLYNENKMKTNLDVKDKQSYAEDYLELDADSFDYYCIPGYYKNRYYIFDLDAAKRLFKKCGVQENKVEEDVQENTEEPVEEVKNLVILNSTRVAGQAAAWGDALKEYGFNIVKVDNYDEKLSDTKIIVSDESQGDALVRYFSNATVEVGTVPEGAEAEIIVGTNDVR